MPLVCDLLGRTLGPVGAVLLAGLLEEQGGVSSKLQALRKVETTLSYSFESTKEEEPGGE